MTRTPQLGYKDCVVFTGSPRGNPTVASPCYKSGAESLLTRILLAGRENESLTQCPVKVLNASVARSKVVKNVFFRLVCCLQEHKKTLKCK